MYENHPPLYLRPSCVGRLSPPSPRPQTTYLLDSQSRSIFSGRNYMVRLSRTAHFLLPTVIEQQAERLRTARQAAAQGMLSSYTIPLLADTQTLLNKGKISWTLKFPLPLPTERPANRRFSSLPLKSGPLENKPLKAPCTTLLPSTTPTSQAPIPRKRPSLKIFLPHQSSLSINGLFYGRFLPTVWKVKTSLLKVDALRRDCQILHRGDLTAAFLTSCLVKEFTSWAPEPIGKWRYKRPENKWLKING